MILHFKGDSLYTFYIDLFIHQCKCLFTGLITLNAVMTTSDEVEEIGLSPAGLWCAE